jgi:hypothetical protein
VALRRHVRHRQVEELLEAAQRKLRARQWGKERRKREFVSEIARGD